MGNAPCTYAHLGKLCASRPSFLFRGSGPHGQQAKLATGKLYRSPERLRSAVESTPQGVVSSDLVEFAPKSVVSKLLSNLHRQVLYPASDLVLLNLLLTVLYPVFSPRNHSYKAVLTSDASNPSDSAHLQAL